VSTDDLPSIYGLTGGIASGKSTASEMFRELGAFVIDADEIAREVVTSPSPALDEIRETFGAEYVHEDGSLHREKLGELIFEDAEARARLNAITHPRIATTMLDRAREAYSDGYDWVIYDAALIVENGLQSAFQGLIVVAASRETQVERLENRDDLERSAALSRIDSQMPLQEKIAVADWVIDNDGSLSETRRQVETVFHEIQEQVADGQT